MYIYLCVYIHIRKFQRSTVIENHEKKKIVKRNQQEEIVRVSQTTRILRITFLYVFFGKFQYLTCLLRIKTSYT